MNDLEKRVARLEIIEECKNVKRQHFYLTDSGYPPDELVELWCEDGTWLGVYTDIDDPALAGTSAQTQYRGKKALRDFWALNGRLYDWVMHIDSSPIITVADDLQSAKGKWTFLMPSTRTVQGAPTATWVGGLHTDEYRKENGVWKFYTVRVDIKIVATHKDGWVPSRYIDEPPV
ncbi:nuclear transport factor 2 family protein [Mesorhizobium sp. B2-4-9]|uniref:nuclear transport factor 2 family protein n=1 Tax=Mesorhizobium sp. B2-4-9 TaxID=2589940 RepID=UPI0015E28F32|nr:nuclear transport factor 2 family protein [Mesorhizobium sp. B2-4-9]